MRDTVCPVCHLSIFDKQSLFIRPMATMGHCGRGSKPHSTDII
jgi:hypothetical protein